jgi:hypothetical protein
MAAGVTKRFWEIGDVVGVLEAWKAYIQYILDSTVLSCFNLWFQCTRNAP